MTDYAGQISLRSVSAGYGKDEILHDVSLLVPRGKITTLAGSNGSGKSTLLKAILGFIPFRGDILIEGVPVRDMGQADRARRVAYLPQSKNIPDISAGRMVLHGRFPYLRYPRRYREQDIEAARDAMRRMGILALSDKQMAALSGGMRQKVYIAMALAQQSPVIIMDEPTTYLDIGQQVLFARLAEQLARDGKTVLLVLHDISLALKISDQIVVLQEGRIVGSGTPEEVLRSGVLTKIYGVEIRSVRTDKGVQYYHEI